MWNSLFDWVENAKCQFQTIFDLEISQIDGLYLFFVSFFFSFGQAGPDPGRSGGKVPGPGLKKLTGPGFFFGENTGPARPGP